MVSVRRVGESDPCRAASRVIRSLIGIDTTYYVAGVALTAYYSSHNNSLTTILIAIAIGIIECELWLPLAALSVGLTGDVTPQPYTSQTTDSR